MVKFTSAAFALSLALSPFTSAQTFSECNPTQKTGCAPNPALNGKYTVDFTKGASTMGSDWKTTSGAMEWVPEGAQMSIKAFGDGPTIQSNWYIFFGRVDVVMRSAPGAGIVSSFVMESDDLDEIDWEMIGSHTGDVQSNYFGKGNTTTYDRGAFHAVQNPASTFTKYSVDWTADRTQWLINDQVVRTLNFADAVGGKNYPQTPMNIRLGNWVAGTPGNSQGTIDWAGGIADMSKGPFNMIVQSVSVTNYKPAGSYSYNDMSGSWQSINISQTPISGSAGSTARSNSTSTEGAGTGGGSAGIGSAGPGSASNSTAEEPCDDGSMGSSSSIIYKSPQTASTSASGAAATGVASNASGSSAATVSVNTSGSSATGAVGAASSSTGSGTGGGSGSGIVANGAASSSAAATPVVSINVGGTSGSSVLTASATTLASAVSAGSSSMSYPLGANGTTSALPAQQTTNDGKRTAVGSTSALAVLLGLLVVAL
ncbi:concanavalin A-like lectin/glucanase [Microthyrium microscopicum]|uniref:Crh-like protein n=1 Tax=Microthyrium microscopicum TaxID=703497 RepID=A0A6A6U5X0_9PEZI|nr:concanavalin A-like lectin/glucanase [Microthyrium microscopicum]